MVLKPKVGYYELSMTFGLPLDKLFKVMGFIKYNIKDNYIEIFNDNDKCVYFEFYNGYWFKYTYDSNNNQIYYETSDSFWEKSYYENNILIKQIDVNGDCVKYVYDKNNKLIKKENYSQ